MEKQKLLDDIKSINGSNYILLSIFFAIFAIFVIFVIRPNVMAVLEQRSRLEAIRTQNQNLTLTIKNLNAIQRVLSVRQKDFALLKEAVPDEPDAYKIANSLKEVFVPHSGGSDFTFDPIEKGKVPTDKSAGKREYKVIASGKYELKSLVDIIYTLFEARNLKIVDRLDATVIRSSNAEAAARPAADSKSATATKYDAQVDVVTFY